MAGIVRSLITRILFRSDETGLKKVTTHTTEAKREMRAASRAAFMLKRSLKEIGKGIRRWAIGVSVGVFATTKLVAGFAKSTDEAAKFAKGLGISIQAYQGMTHAAALSGVSIQELNVALPKLAQNAGNAADGSKTAALAFSRAGVEIKTAGGKFKDPIQLMNELADSFKEGRFQGNKTQVLMNLFGRSGKKMGVLLAEGSTGIKKAMIEAEKLGIVMTAAQAKIAEDFNDELLRTKSVLLGVRNQIALHLLPAINRNMKAFVAWAKEGDNLKNALARLIIVAKALAVALALVVSVKLGQNLAVLVSVTKKAVFWTRLQGKATLLAYAPYIALAAAIAAVVLIIQSLVVWSRGGKSAVGDLFKSLGIADKMRKLADGAAVAWRWLGKQLLALGAMMPDIARHIDRVVSGIHALLSALWNEFGADLTELGKAMVDLFREVYPIMVTLAEAAHRTVIDLIGVLAAAWRDLKPVLVEIGKEIAKVWRDEIAPALQSVIAELQNLWVVAKPILKSIWELEKDWLGILLKLTKEVIPFLGTVVARTFQAIAIMIKLSIKQLTVFVKSVTFIVNSLREAFNLMLAIAGLQKVGVGGIGAAVAAAPKGGRAGAPAGPVTNTISLGTLSVTVQGTADMTPAEFQTALESGAKKVFQEEINNAVAGLRSLVPG